MNTVTIVGHLGRDPEMRSTPSGRAVCNLAVATDESYTDSSGQRHDHTEWHRVVLWGKQAELAERYLTKGRLVGVEGRLQTRSWEDQQTGQKRYSTEIVGRRVEFLGGRGDGQQAQQQAARPAQPAAPRQPSRVDSRVSSEDHRQQQAPPRNQAPPVQGNVYDDGDIPF